MRSPWLDLLTATRILGAAAAVALLLAHRVSPYDPALILAAISWTAVSLLAIRRFPALQRSVAVWVLDGGVALWLVWLSTDWRSPFYVFALTTLILPATALSFRRAIGWGAGFALGYLVVALATERLPGDTLQSTIRLETIATHLMVPVVVVLALAYASQVLARLREERARSERLAVEAERQRIAWELHDSAKQRVHAAHLVLSALDGQLDGSRATLLEQALAELRAATGDMDTSVAELRMPLAGRPVDRMLRERAHELAAPSGLDIVVRGRLPDLPPVLATHAFRIASEALTNAVRHARATRVEVEMRDGGQPSIAVRDDGVGMPSVPRPGSHGLSSMRNRAATIGATLEVESGGASPGTEVRLVLPAAEPTEGASA